MAALQRQQLSKLCTSSEVFEKSQSIMRLAAAKTRPGSGFVVKSTVALPAVCAYLASEQLNTGEVSLQSAMSAACVTQAEFSDILRKVRAALGTEEGNTIANVTYQALVDAYHVHPREDAIACMEDAEAALPRADILKERYGVQVMSCAIFYWVCQLMEETSVQERSFRRTYSLPTMAFKAAVKVLDKQCDTVAEQIKSYLLQKRGSTQASTSSQRRPIHTTKPASPQKSPTKSAIRPWREISTPMTTPSRKRTVAFKRLSSDGGDGNDDGAAFPETPTKKRRITSSSSTVPTASSSPTKCSSAAATAAFHAALKGTSPAKPPVVAQQQRQGESPTAGPSTPHRPRSRLDRMSEATPTSVQADAQPSPSRSRSQGQLSPTRRAMRRRFRPVFLEQQQWCARDPKVERMWAAAVTLRDEMVELHGRPFQGIVQREGAVVGAA